MRESASRWSPSIQNFSDDMELRCRHPSRQNDQSQRWCWASVCQLPTIVKPTVAHSLQRASCLGVLPTWSRTSHVVCQFCLSFDVHLASTLLATTSCMLPQSTLPCTHLTHRTFRVHLPWRTCSSAGTAMPLCEGDSCRRPKAEGFSVSLCVAPWSTSCRVQFR